MYFREVESLRSKAGQRCNILPKIVSTKCGLMSDQSYQRPALNADVIINSG